MDLFFLPLNKGKSSSADLSKLPLSHAHHDIMVPQFMSAWIPNSSLTTGKWCHPMTGGYGWRWHATTMLPAGVFRPRPVTTSPYLVSGTVANYVRSIPLDTRHDGE